MACTRMPWIALNTGTDRIEQELHSVSFRKRIHDTDSDHLTRQTTQAAGDLDFVTVHQTFAQFGFINSVRSYHGGYMPYSMLRILHERRETQVTEPLDELL